MDSIEKDAGTRHGTFTYNLIWKARSSGKKLLWLAVLLLSTASFFSYLIIWLALWFVMSSLFDAFTLPLSIYMLLAAPFGFLCKVCLLKENSIGFASNMYGIAADMKRLPSSFASRIMFVLAGGFAVMTAFGVWLFWKGRLQKLAMTELDVLGSIFARSGMPPKAQKIFTEMAKRYERRNDRRNSVSETKEISVSYALACKWMLACDSSGCNDVNRAYLKSIIKAVMDKYLHDLGPETRIRLHEALGDKAEMEEAKRQIAAKVH